MRCGAVRWGLHRGLDRDATGASKWAQLYVPAELAHDPPGRRAQVADFRLQRGYQPVGGRGGVGVEGRTHARNEGHVDFGGCDGGHAHGAEVRQQLQVQRQRRGAPPLLARRGSGRGRGGIGVAHAAPAQAVAHRVSEVAVERGCADEAEAGQDVVVVV